MLQNCFTLPMLPTNAYFHSVCLVSMSLCYNICLEKEIKVLLGQSYMFGNVIITVTKNDTTHISFYRRDRASLNYSISILLV